MQASDPSKTLLFCPGMPVRMASERRPEGLPAEGALVGGRYRLGRLLGTGQFGRVYRAERADLPQHHVALKLLDSSVYSGRNVERELKLLSAVAHPNIVQLADHGVGEGYVWFTMPLYTGSSLEDLLRSRCLSPREAFDVFGPIAEGLEVLHAVGLRHQDVKPENLFLASFQQSRFPLLLDLGAAAPARASQPVAGTLLYAAPEQRRALMACVRGEPSQEALTEAIDTYNWGATLLHALVGDAWFPGVEAERTASLEDAALVLERASLERAACPLRYGALRNLPEAARDRLSDVLTGWMALDPAARPSMKQARAQLAVLLESEHLQQRRRQLGRAAAWALGAAGAVGVLALGAQRQKEEHLRQCTEELLSSQQQAVEQVSGLDQCKGLLGAHAQDARRCHDELHQERAQRQEAERQRAEGGAMSARLERCEGERRAQQQTCTAEVEALTRTQTALTMERDLLKSERDQLRNRTAPGVGSARAPASSMSGATAAPALPPSARPSARARR
ncbi:MAG: serine/threonine protein kinase [Polyangiaceae bacterium]|jgi:serine/threonine protein kinase|nr:serine/threonine protein kinase [Polyangiaceae bacterium]